MSDTMMFSIATMPYELAMCDELSRYQFYTNTQRLVAALVRNAVLEEAAEEADRWQTALHDPRYECDCAAAIRAMKEQA